ncbi:hypothetical protein IR215_12200 [Simulacricoccus sp. 17bor-14]|nr:hypothetical protein [Simulacricoccus sp. 17bor-14]
MTAALLLLSLSAAAQDRGTVRIVGHVSEVASLRFQSSTLAGEGVTGQNAGNSLNYTLNLGDLREAEGRPNGVHGGVVTLALRTNTAYVLTATVQGSGFRAGPGEIGLGDIGFGVPSAAITPSGDHARADGTQVVNAAKFDSDPLTASTAGGRPHYAATLADLAHGPTPLLQGERISYGGTVNAPNNALLVSTNYAVHPQMFRRNDRFEATVTYTLTTP